MNALRRLIGPNVTLVLEDILLLSRMTVCAARLRADAGQIAGQSIWWGFVVHGELTAGTDAVWYAVRTNYHRLGWSTSYAAARILDRPIVEWKSVGLRGPGSWELWSTEFGYATVVEPEALATERRLLSGARY